MDYSNEFIVPCDVINKDNNIFITIGAVNFTPDGMIKDVMPIETLPLDEYHKKYRPIGVKVRSKKRLS